MKRHPRTKSPLSVVVVSVLLLPTAAIAAAPPAASADTLPERPTFYKDVLPILQAHCQDCHREAGNSNSGMVAPMALVEYDEVRPWARAIARETVAREMPPWFAAPEFHGQFEEERGLSETEIETLTRWARTGAMAGDASEAPPPHVFPSTAGWTLGEPDLVIPMPEPYWVADEIEDVQPRFDVVLTEDQLPEDRWIQWIEFRPGNPKLVHHGGARVQSQDAEGKPVVDPIAGGKIIGTAPGDGPDIWPVGYGKLVRKGSRIIFGLHYHKEPGPGTGGWDQSMIAIKWHDQPVQHVVRSAGVSSRGWEIPPYHTDWQVGAARTFEEDSYILNMMPHMHTRGKSARYEVVYPDDRRETILWVPRYNYNWQLTYSLKEPKFVPAGSRLEVTMVFDNSTGNPFLIEGPERPVGFGGMTTDEMNIGWTEYANAKPIESVELHDFGTAGTGVEDIDDESP
ncbi:MAG TPA: hypothetical protein VNB06_07305 [Thermoanaerobaculia bacterium]|nr:hypothetical protein [Thermoanaerobaculia bacterium]